MLPVVAADGTYLGTATARTAAETLADGAHDTVAVSAITHLPASVTADTDLATALDTLVTAQGAGLPVLDASHDHLIGWITHQSVLTAMNTSLTKPVAAAS